MPQTRSDLAAVILAAGLGTRMRSARPKVMAAVAGRAMVGHVAASVAALKPSRIALVIGPEPEMAAVIEAAVAAAPAANLIPVEQAERRGTGHAVRVTKAALAGHRGDVVIVFGDTPLVTPATLRRLVALRRRGRHAVVVAGFRPADPLLFGRLVVDRAGRLERIVEARDATAAERAIGLCNAGLMVADGRILFDLLARLRPDNAKRELYLTDLVRLARARGRSCATAEIPVDEAFGIDSRAGLAAAEAMMQARLRAAAMAGGAQLVSDETILLSFDTRLGRDATVGPYVVFGPGVSVGDGAEIRPFSHLEGCSVAAGATIGPFARLRPGTTIGEGARVGNFVEVKAAIVGRGAKINHLAYIGDARIGAKANVGAGTITCNYDGFGKFVTEIGEGAFVGSNSALIAPVTIGAGAYVASGSVITTDVPADALAVARGRQETRPGWAAKFRARRAAQKAAPRTDKGGR